MQFRQRQHPALQAAAHDNGHIVCVMVMVRSLEELTEIAKVP